MDKSISINEMNENELLSEFHLHDRNGWVENHDRVLKIFYEVLEKLRYRVDVLKNDNDYLRHRIKDLEITIMERRRIK